MIQRCGSMPGVEQSRKRQSLNRAGIPNLKWKLAFIAFPRDHNVGCNAIEMCIEGVRRYALSSLRFERSIPHLASWPCCVLLLVVRKNSVRRIEITEKSSF